MIYELWLLKNNPVANAAFAKVTEQERQFLDEALNMDLYGAGWVLYCESSWANDEYRNWGITSYQTMEGRIAQTRALDQAGWYCVADMVSLMGTLEGPVSMPNFPNPIYDLWITRANPVTWTNLANESEAASDERWSKWQESLNRVGACLVLFCNSSWCDESRPSFGVMAYPSIEARMQHVADTEKLKWPLYYDVFNLLGISV